MAEWWSGRVRAAEEREVGAYLVVTFTLSADEARAGVQEQRRPGRTAGPGGVSGMAMPDLLVP